MTGPTEREIAAAARAALRGELVVTPTETVYGIGTRPDDAGATARLFEAKRRPRGLELPVLVPTAGEAARIGRLDDRAGALAEGLWPGPLTIVVRRTGASAEWDLGGDPDTIGLRLPGHPVPLRLLGLTGPLAVTSANRSGRGTPRTLGRVREVFGDLVSVYLDGGPAPGAAASTVVDLTGPEPRVLRPGPIMDAVRDLLGLRPAGA